MTSWRSDAGAEPLLATLLSYEKAHVASNIINAIKETKIIPRLDFRVRDLDGGT
jgi:hypothetical protein